MELQNVINMSRELSGRKFYDELSLYPQALAKLSAERCRELGERYLAETRIQRKTGRPFFIDKMPNNWMHVGFIHLILPNAKIIDARRHPLACCFSDYQAAFRARAAFHLQPGGHRALLRQLRANSWRTWTACCPARSTAFSTNR